ncbi:cell wall metabolism sensor histidine kinase WalK [Microbacterium sp. C7(2022)]|uniref:sensor histidine kinase n=1 Tax=Microbacterium sp. C7(2022) TaxID=2992759 RepID=UPI00237A331E|nr:ATP-binding protein [Microbacterium sp. C7(2022)]MDE0545810.1 HAMP domain-containing histidine kinase [Microbacterium sp. C7(2022)]
MARASAEAVANPPETRGRPPWTLQRRLIVTIVSIVSMILVFVAITMSAILGQVLEGRLNSQLDATTQQTASRIQPMLFTGQSAAEILTQMPSQPGLLLAVETPVGGASAAVMDADGVVVSLNDEQIDELVEGLRGDGPLVIDIEGLDTYRVKGVPVGQSVVLVGLSRSDVTATMGQMLITIGLLTAGGLILLAAATAWTIRAGLAPLRSVADTAERVATLPLDQGEVRITERVPSEQSDPRTEIGRVGASLNVLLDHVDDSLTARQQNEERMRRFVADASHELRTPLASIRGYSELSLRALTHPQPADPSWATETTMQSLDRIQAQSLRMTALVEDLLLLARLDEGQELVNGSVDLTRLALEAVGDARPAGPDHTWHVDVPDEPVSITGDAARLHQVVANLLANARTHTPAGTTVTLSVESDEKGATLRVHDDGPGVDPSLRDELFERFARADRSRARQTGGTGLGLSIVRAIVDAHHGRIHVDSRPGDTTFEVTLPAQPPRTEGDGPRAEDSTQ